MQLDKTDIGAVLEVIDDIADRNYSLQELIALCVPVEAIVIFDGIEIIPGKNVLLALALMVNADVWDSPIDDNGEFLFHRLRVCIRQRAIELEKTSPERFSH